jgi:hypothetical protein
MNAALQLRPKFMADEDSRRKAVGNPLNAYETLLEDLTDLAAAAERREEQTVPYTMTLNQDDFSFPNCEKFTWTEKQIAFIVNYAVFNSGIRLTTPMEFRNFGAKEIVKGIKRSTVGYIESKSGYFIISEDMMLHISVTYSCWD